MPSIGEALKPLGKRALNRIRNQPDLDRMVADGLELGEGTHIGRPVYLDRLHPWLITIGAHVTLAPYVIVITHDASLAHYTGQTAIGRVVIGNRVNVGVGAILLPGTIIGEDSVIGAGAVVSREVPPGSMVVGNPAQVSPLKPVVAFQRASAARAPSWPREGWNVFSGITEERKREQREALADGVIGYVPATPAPGSPHALGEQRS